jgi:hypothetical protein
MTVSSIWFIFYEYEIEKYISIVFIKRKNKNTVTLINRFILFSNESINPSLNITEGSTANNPIMMIIIMTQKALMISANEYILVAGNFADKI